MDHNAYQLLALGARYWFVLLAAVLVWRGAAALLHEHYRRKKLLKKLPDAGMVGEMRDIDNDRAYPLPREGVLGGGRACDIRLRGLRRRDINFAFVEGKGLLLTPCHSRGEVLLDGAPLGKGGYALHGAMLRVGGYTLRIRLFAGMRSIGTAPMRMRSCTPPSTPPSPPRSWAAPPIPRARMISRACPCRPRFKPSIPCPCRR